MPTLSNFQLLVIEDDEIVIASIRRILPANWSMTALNALDASIQKQFFHCVLVDLHLTKGSAQSDGLTVISEICKAFPRAEVFAISGKETLELMEASLEKGAKGFLAKPINPEKLLRLLDRTESLFSLRDIEQSKDHPQTQWIGDGKSSQRVLECIATCRGSTEPILIVGETGTGKEVVARLLNQQEKGRPFVPVNVAALPENLFEAEFFGYMKGAFTGADSNRPGLVEAANNGDLFLDEIEALPIHLQPKLLRFLESGEFRRVGGRDLQTSNVRVIAASNEDLSEKVKQGQFRQDLLFRISGAIIPLPRLKDRTEDLPTLVNQLLKNSRPRLNKSFHADALLALAKHPWPGNVRELKRVVEQLNFNSPLPIIRAVDVQKILGGSDSVQTNLTATNDLDLNKGFAKLVAEFEEKVIRKCLSTTDTVESAAELLQMSRSNFYKKLKDYGIE